VQRVNIELQPEPAGSGAMQNVEVGIPADSQVAVACGYMTRAKQSLAHVTLDELEQTLPLPPDEKLLPLEDGEEYQYFLQVSIHASTPATKACLCFFCLGRHYLVPATLLCCKVTKAEVTDAEVTDAYVSH